MNAISTEVQQTGDVNVISVAGYVSANSHEPMQAAFAEAGVGGCSKILFAFRDGDNINSAGIGILLGLIMEGQENDQEIRIAHPSSHFRKIFEIVGLTKYVSVFSSVEEALTEF